MRCPLIFGCFDRDNIASMDLYGLFSHGDVRVLVFMMNHHYGGTSIETIAVSFVPSPVYAAFVCVGGLCAIDLLVRRHFAVSAVCIWIL